MKLKINIPEISRKLIGIEVVNLIKEKTRSGIDKDGKAFKAYSTRPFAMPSGATTRLAIKTLENNDGIGWFTSKKTGSKWIYIKKGYKALKAARRPQDGGKVNLTNEGQMLKDLGVIGTPENLIQIGFNRAENAQKALWNIANGRDFLGVKDSELEKIAEKYLTKNISIEVVQ